MGPCNQIRLAYTKKSDLIIYSQCKPDYRTIKRGASGREVRTITSSGRLMASGSEDTSLRLWTYDKGEGSDFGVTQTLAYNSFHTAGLQKVKWASLERKDLLSQAAKHLFSSSGNEEFFVWKVNTEGSFQLGSKRSASSFGIGLTRKSLNRCQLSSVEDSRDDGFVLIVATKCGF